MLLDVTCSSKSCIAFLSTSSRHFTARISLYQMSSPSSPVDEVNPFSSDPSPFNSSSPPSSPHEPSSPSQSQPVTSAAYPFSADPYAQHTQEEDQGERGGEEEEQVTTSPPLPQTPIVTGSGGQQQERDSYQKTSREIIQVRLIQTQVSNLG